MTDMMALKLAICLAIFTGLLMVVFKLWEWRRRPETRPCKWFGHDRKYVAIRLSACVASDSPEASGRGFPCTDHNHKIGDKNITIARWVCRRCPVMEEECFNKGKDWKIEHERIVPDVKKWANWSQPLPDPSEAARQKLKELQERLDKSEGQITVKTEIVKKENYCTTCGWNHDGPCLPPPPPAPTPPVNEEKLKADLEALRKDGELRDCAQCGAQHTGPCVPGGIS